MNMIRKLGAVVTLYPLGYASDEEFARHWTEEICRSEQISSWIENEFLLVTIG
jgi:hypothetical protein